LDLVSHRCLREGHVQPREERLPIALEPLVVLHAEMHIQIPRSSTGHAIMSLAGDLHGVAAFHSRRNGQQDPSILRVDALAMAFVAWVLNRPTMALAGRTGSRRLHPANQGATDLGDHARALTVWASSRCLPAFSAFASASIALGKALRCDFLLETV